MGSLQAETEEKQEMDDSGCIQDETPPANHPDYSYHQQVQLLDLSDDVLLLILRHLSPRDLKALGFACPRLGSLVLDRSLWQTVDARGQPWGRARLCWYLAHALHEGTKELKISGYAREAKEYLKQAREKEEAKQQYAGKGDGETQAGEGSDGAQQSRAPRVIEIPALGPRAQLYIDDEPENSPDGMPWPSASNAASCPAALLTLTPSALRQLADTCSRLTELALQYCNINCDTTGLNLFPPTLSKLSLRGSKCYNLPMDRSFLFKIQDYLPELQTLDVSECDWMEPASLLPLSKLPALKHLYMRACCRLTEFVAYASLATRYGFTKLQTLDLRGSPVGDSEVSALGWLPALSSLWLSPVTPHTADMEHKPAALSEDWEEREPEYYKNKIPPELLAASKDCKSPIEQKWSPEKAEPVATCSETKLPPKTDPETSKTAPETSKTDAETSNRPENALKRKPSPPKDGSPTKRRRNESPSSSDDEGAEQPNKKPVNEGASTSRNEEVSNQNIEAEPRHHVLYVNVGQQLHAVYRLSLDNEHIFSFRRHQNTRRINPRNIFISTPTPHLDVASLVTDSAIRRFGRADGEDINYVHIGPNGPYAAAANLSGARPNRSSLTRLSVTGFRHITDRSLAHLATAAPSLEYIDFSETNVTAQGVENFKSLRPDCEVIFSPYVEKRN